MVDNIRHVDARKRCASTSPGRLTWSTKWLVTTTSAFGWSHSEPLVSHRRLSLSTTFVQPCGGNRSSCCHFRTFEAHLAMHLSFARATEDEMCGPHRRAEIPRERVSVNGSFQTIARHQ
jgi:hypothetical protein